MSSNLVHQRLILNQILNSMSNNKCTAKFYYNPIHFYSLNIKIFYLKSFFMNGAKKLLKEKIRNISVIK